MNKQGIIFHSKQQTGLFGHTECIYIFQYKGWYYLKILPELNTQKAQFLVSDDLKTKSLKELRSHGYMVIPDHRFLQDAKIQMEAKATSALPKIKTKFRGLN